MVHVWEKAMSGLAMRSSTLVINADASGIRLRYRGETWNRILIKRTEFAAENSARQVGSFLQADVQASASHGTVQAVRKVLEYHRQSEILQIGVSFYLHGL